VSSGMTCDKKAFFFECFPYVCPEPVLVTGCFPYVCPEPVLVKRSSLLASTVGGKRKLPYTWKMKASVGSITSSDSAAVRSSKMFQKLN
jgi:hypothetical protein